jgi:hypothetical protein
LEDRVAQWPEPERAQEIGRIIGHAPTGPQREQADRLPDLLGRASHAQERDAIDIA